MRLHSPAALPTVPMLAAADDGTAGPLPEAWRRMFSRPRRVLAMLIVLWLLNICDLLFTLWAHELGGFLEVNPVAQNFMATGLLNNLVAYKLTLCLAGSLLLFRVRHHPLSEVGCLAGLGIYGYVSWLWLAYYQWAAAEHPISLYAGPLVPY